MGKNMKLLTGIVCLLALSVASAIAKQVGTRVVNGTDAPLGKYPSMVSLQANFGHTCGGTILNEYFVLTAAHCVAGAQIKFLSALSGTNDLREGGEQHQAAEVIFHEGYDPDDWWKNDVAVVRVEQPFVFDLATAPVVLPPQLQSSPPGATATLVGWGLSKIGDPTTEVQQEVDLLVYSDEECGSIHEGRPHESNICAGAPGGWKGQCSGDSGGPLFVNGYQAGIVSWSKKPCGLPPYPGVYTEVAHFVEWIDLKSKL